MDSVHSILLLQVGALGDCVLQLRIAQALRQCLPQARITWLCRDCWLPLARRCSHVDRAFGMDSLRFHRLLPPNEPQDEELFDFLRSFDLIIDGIVGPNSGLLRRLGGFARIGAIGYYTAPRTDPPEHVSRQWLHAIAGEVNTLLPDLAAELQRQAASFELTAPVLLRTTPDDLAEATSLLDAAKVDTAHPLVLVHPGSGGRHKCWPIDCYTRLTEQLAQRSLTPLMILGPVEMDRMGKQAESLRQRHRLIAAPELTGLIGLASRATAHVGNDSGPAHLAAALGTPTLALFGPTDPRLWQPLGPRATVLQSQKFETDWTDLPPERVAAALHKLISR